MTETQTTGPEPTDDLEHQAAQSARALFEDLHALPEHLQEKLSAANDRAADMSELNKEALTENERLHYEATHDPLTRLRNRAGFSEIQDQYIEDSESNGESFGLIFIDAGNLKELNDNLGHAAGDEGLQMIAHFLQQREGDVAGRLGGDEFAYLVKFKHGAESVGGQRESDQTDEEQLAGALERYRREMNDIIRQHPEFKNTGFNVAAGSALYIPGKGVTAEALLKMGDTNMYEDKEKQRLIYGAHRKAS